jgi:hypothetical protein
MQTMHILLLNVRTKEFVTEKLVNANASLTTKELLVNELCAQINAAKLVCASLRTNLLLMPEEFTIPLGMPKWK